MSGRERVLASRREVFSSPSNRIGFPLVRLQYQGAGPDFYPLLSYWQDALIIEQFIGSGPAGGFTRPRNSTQIAPGGMSQQTAINRTQSVRLAQMTPPSGTAMGTRIFGKGARRTDVNGGLETVIPGARALGVYVCAASANVRSTWRLYAKDQYGEPFSEVKTFVGRTHEYPLGFTQTNWTGQAENQEPDPHKAGTAAPNCEAWPPGQRTIQSITVGNPTILTFDNTHGLSTGDGVVVAGVTGTPSPLFPFLVNSNQLVPHHTVTFVSPTAVSIPVDTTGAIYNANSGAGYGLNYTTFVSWWNSQWANLSPRPVDEAVEGPRFYSPDGMVRGPIRTPQNVQDCRWGNIPVARAFQFERPISQFLWAEFLGGDSIAVDDVIVFHLKTLRFGLRANVETLDDIIGGQVRYFPISTINNLGLLEPGGAQDGLIWSLNPLETAIHKRFLEIETKFNVVNFQPESLIGSTPVPCDEGAFRNPYIYNCRGDEAVSHLGDMLLTFASWELILEIGWNPE